MSAVLSVKNKTCPPDELSGYSARWWYSHEIPDWGRSVCEHGSENLC